MAGPVTVRLLSHGSGKGPATVPGGRAYGNTAGSVADVPPNSHDINILTANGWSKIGPSGTTAQRPDAANISAGTPYMDTTLGKVVIFDGVGYRDPMNGNVV